MAACDCWHVIYGLWTLNFTWIACVTKYSSFIFFPSHLKMAQTILSSWAVQKQAEGWMWTASCCSFSQLIFAVPRYIERSPETVFKVRSFSSKCINAEGKDFLEKLSEDAPVGLLGNGGTFRQCVLCLCPAASKSDPAHPNTGIFVLLPSSGDTD